MLEAPEEKHASEFSGPRRVSASPNRRLRRDFSDDFADDLYDDDDDSAGRKRAGVRLKFRGLPRTRRGWILAGCTALVLLGLCGCVFWVARNMLLHDERFVIESSSSIEFVGNAHLSRAQLLSIFGQDVERNIFYVSLAQRRAELESLPWVQRATVMRLLPNRLRVLIVERTPVAFVRQGNHIGLVDASGVLLDMPVDSPANTRYSFPVVTGISADDPLSTRAARMKIYERFTSELDGSGEKISEELSEVDLSNPEDVKALIPDHSSEVLVHFGDEQFLDRYREFEDHLPAWRTQYPKLSSVDMRYDRQVVLEMQPGTGVPVAPSAGAAAADAAVDAAVTPAKASAVSEVKARPKAAAAVVPRPAAHVVHAASKPEAKIRVPAIVKPPVAKGKPVAKTAPLHVTAQSEVAFDAPVKKGAAHPAAKGKTHPGVVRPDSDSVQYHPPQVVHK